MSASTFPKRLTFPHTLGKGRAPVTDITNRITSWGRRGVVAGAVFGFAFGAILVAIPLATDMLTFGVFGTLVIAAVECAVIAGGFAALAAALIDRGGATQPESAPTAGFRVVEAGRRDRDVPHATWPIRRAPLRPISRTALPASPDMGWEQATFTEMNALPSQYDSQYERRPEYGNPGL